MSKTTITFKFADGHALKVKGREEFVLAHLDTFRTFFSDEYVSPTDEDEDEDEDEESSSAEALLPEDVGPLREDTSYATLMCHLGRLQHEGQEEFSNDDINEAFAGETPQPNVAALVHNLKYKKMWLRSSGRKLARFTNIGAQVAEYLLARAAEPAE